MNAVVTTGVVIPPAQAVVASRKSIRLHCSVGESGRPQQSGKTKLQIGRFHASENFSQVHGESIGLHLPLRHGVLTPV